MKPLKKRPGQKLFLGLDRSAGKQITAQSEAETLPFAFCVGEKVHIKPCRVIEAKSKELGLAHRADLRRGR